VLPDPAAQSDSPDDADGEAGLRPDGAPSAHDSPVPVAAVQSIRFCRACGTPWESDWLECALCARAHPSTVTAVAAERAFRQDQREIRSAVSLYFALLGVSVVTMIALLVAEREPTAGEELLACGAMAAITTVWCLVASRADVVPQLAKRVWVPWFPLAVLAAVPTYAVATAAVMGLDAAFEIPDIGYLEPFMEDGWGFGWAVVAIAVMPAIFEEIAFRGIIFGVLQRVLGPTEALLVSALMFAILHLSVPSMPHLFLMGLVLGWLRLRTGSLLPGMLTHFTHNLLVLLAERNEGILPW